MADSPSKSTRRGNLKEITTKLSKEELIRRLKALLQTLQKQDDGEGEEFAETAAVFATPFMLKHSDKDVRSYVACCLLELFRVFVPSPPWNEDQIKDIFRMIVQELKGLQDVQSISYKRHLSMLESLSTVRTFTVVAGLDDAHDICTDLFRLFFTIIGSQHNTRVKGYMLDVLVMTMQNMEAIQQDMLDAILTNLLEPRKTKRPEAYQLAVGILDKCSAQIEPCIQLFFNNALVLGNPTGSELDDKAYSLIFQLYKVNKSLLLSVLPQLEFKLKGAVEKDRLDALKLLGKMFRDEESELADNNKALWNCYLGRFLDISSEVRVECVQMAKQFLLSSNAQLRVAVAAQLLQRCHDPDDKVRLETVMTICEAAEENLYFIPDKLLEGVKERMRDKKWLIRKEAVTRVGNLYKKIASLPAITRTKSMEKIDWAVDKILHLYIPHSADDRLCVEKVVHGCLIPVDMNMENRMKRLITVYTSLDEASVNVFDAMLKHRSNITTDVKALLDAYAMEKGEDRERAINLRSLAIARVLPEPVKAQDHLRKLLAMFTDKTFYKLFCTSVDITQHCPKIIKSVTEIMKKLTAKHPILETVRAMLDRACPMMIDAPSFVVLLKEIKKLLEGFDDEDDVEDSENSCTSSQDELTLIKAKKALSLVEAISTCLPEVFQSKSAYELLLIFLKHKDHGVVESALQSVCQVISGLEALDKNICSIYHTTLSKMVLNGNCKQSKFALRCLHKMSRDSSNTMDRLYKNLTEYLSFNDPRLSSALVALSELALLSPDVFSKRHKEVIMNFVVKEVITQDRVSTASKKEDYELEWGSEHEVSEETQIKIKALKLMTRWLLGLTDQHTEKGSPVFRLFDKLLRQDGDLCGNGKVGMVNKARLRMAAGSCLLKLVQNTNYIDVITVDQYQQMALLMQDSCYEIREQFTTKLHKALDSLKLPLDYYAFLVLAAVDVSKERKIKVSKMISKNAQTRREYSKQHTAAAARPHLILPEYVIPYIVHLLAHHADFKLNDHDSLSQFKEYVWYFLEPLMGTKADNYSFLKKLLENIKMTKDAQEPDSEEANQKIYTMCDLAIGCIMTKTHTFTLKDFPGNLVLPKKLFIALPPKTGINMKSYLPKSFNFTPKRSKAVTGFDLKPVKEKKRLEEEKHVEKGVRGRKRKEIPPKPQSETSDTEDEPSPKKKSKTAKLPKTQGETVQNYPPLRGRPPGAKNKIKETSSSSQDSSSSKNSSKSSSSSKNSSSSSKNSSSKQSASKTNNTKKVTPAKEVAKVTRKLYRDTSSNKGSTEKNSSKKKNIQSSRTQNIPKRTVRNLSNTKELSSDIENEIGSGGEVSPVKDTSKRGNRTALKVKSPSNKKTSDLNKNSLRTHQTKMDSFLKHKKKASPLKVTSSPIKEYPRRLRSPTKRFSPSKHRMHLESEEEVDSEGEMDVDEEERPPAEDEETSDMEEQGYSEEVPPISILKRSPTKGTKERTLQSPTSSQNSPSSLVIRRKTRRR